MSLLVQVLSYLAGAAALISIGFVGGVWWASAKLEPPFRHLNNQSEDTRG